MPDISHNNSKDRLPPQNLEAEQSVLGSLMIDGDAIEKVADVLSPDDFYRPAHKEIYRGIIDLYERSEPIDLLSVASRLKERERLDEIGGKGYLASLANSVPTATNVLHYAKIVQQKKILRDLIEASHHIEKLGFEEETDIDLTLDDAERRILNISQRALQQEFLHIKPFLTEAFERVDKLHKGTGVLRGIATGFIDLDNILGGLQKSDLIILAARPSLGKSSLAMDIARHIACQEKQPVGIFSLEMSKDQVVDRLIASQARLDLWKLRTGRLSSDAEDNDFAKLREAISTLSETPIFIDDAPSPNVIQMRTMARRLQTRHGLGLIIVDYLQLMEARKSSDSMVQQITDISRSLKGLARELNVPVLALSQLSRAVEQRTPQIPRLSDLRESGGLEQDADVVLFIYREDREKQNSERKNIADIMIAKHRNGPIGKVELFFNENHASFQNLERRYEE